MLLYRSPAFAMRSIVGVGMTPPNVLGTPKPESSVMMSRIFGAFLGGTTRGAHHGFDWRASFLMTPPNFGSGGGSCFPSIVVVAPGEPGGGLASRDAEFFSPCPAKAQRSNPNLPEPKR